VIDDASVYYRIFRSIVAEDRHPAYRILPLLQAARRTRCFGSTALDLSYLASGAFSLLAVASPARAFDCATGMLILLEAGCVITDLEGNAIDSFTVGLKRTATLLTCKNRIAHQKALDPLARK
jgi:myo-inositol-1(or 4)-monophosphatase